MEREQEPQRIPSAQVQQALRIAELGSDLVMLFDAGGVMLHVSDGLRALLGLPPDEAPAQLAQRIHPDDAEPLHAQRRRAASLPDDAIVQARYRLQDAQGRWHWLRERTAVLDRGADGAATVLMAVARDVTTPRQAQETLPPAGSLPALPEAAVAGAWRLDRRAGTLWCDERAAALHGVAPSELPRPIAEVMAHVLPKDLARWQAALDALPHTAGTWRVEYRVQLPQGEVHRLACRAQLAPSGDLATGVVQDATAAVSVDGQRARDLAHLDELAANAPVGIAFVDDSFRVLRVNRAAAELAGRPPEQMVGRTVEALMASMWPTLAPHYQAVRERGLPISNVEVTGALREGESVRTFLCHFVPVPLETGRHGIGLMLYDITERKRTEQELVAAKQAAVDANAAKDRFLATLSHELRTPLTPILLSARILELRPDDRDTVLGRAEVIRRSVETEVRLIDDLLDLTRISRDKLGLVAAPVSLHEVALRAVEVCRDDAQAAQVTVILDLAAQADLMRGDAQRLQQILWNLLKNAIKFSPAGATVTLSSVNPDPQSIRFTVRDHGIGFRADDLPRLFQPFEQGDAAITRQFGGLGLGLALVQRLVSLHGGDVYADSDGPGCGAAFVVTLPLMKPVEPARPSAAPQAAMADATADATAPHSSAPVLLVEDHADTAQTLSTLLRAAGWAVVTVETAAAALEAARTTRLCLVVSDLSLPDGDGCDLLPLLHQEDPSLPAIAMTGHGMDADMSRTRAAGYARHFVKPVEVAALLEAMRELVDPGRAPVPAAGT
jgi:PAS domain S-box-containing protein